MANLVVGIMLLGIPTKLFILSFFRAAMKMAEMDASFDFMFTDPKDANGV